MLQLEEFQAHSSSDPVMGKHLAKRQGLVEREHFPAHGFEFAQVPLTVHLQFCNAEATFEIVPPVFVHLLLVQGGGEFRAQMGRLLGKQGSVD
jgi:hypothetical protein